MEFSPLRKVFAFYLEHGLETPQKEQKLGVKGFSKTSVMDGVKKEQKQGRDERMQEHSPTSTTFIQMLGSLLHSFISALFLSFSGSIHNVKTDH